MVSQVDVEIAKLAACLLALRAVSEYEAAVDGSCLLSYFMTNFKLCASLLAYVTDVSLLLFAALSRGWKPPAQQHEVIGPLLIAVHLAKL